jgi:cob(I)alamin adenosyltransferase
MKIYTKTGDNGETSLFAGGRVRKDHKRVQVYGTLDEANSALGFALTLLPKELNAVKDELIGIQNQLFVVGAELATPEPDKLQMPLVSESEILGLETAIDRMESGLPKLQSFVLPGGSSAAAYLHVVRTIVRRAERQLIELHLAGEVRPLVIQYLNRLSDYCFVVTRHINHALSISETPWNPRKN